VKDGVYYDRICEQLIVVKDNLAVVNWGRDGAMVTDIYIYICGDWNEVLTYIGKL